LFAALQRRKSLDDLRSLISPDVAAIPDNYYGLKPLFWALSYGAPAEVLRLLLVAHPEAAKDVHPTEGWTPLHYAERLDADGVRLLLEHCPGAASAKDAKGALPLHWAAEHDAPPEVVRLLLEASREAAFQEDSCGRLPVRLAVDNQASADLIALLRSANPSGSAFAVLPSAPREEPLPVGLLFPGSGSQYVGMLEALKDVPAVRDMLQEASTILGYDLLELCLKGPEDRLQEPRHYQPALYVAGLAAYEQLKAENPEIARRCQAAAGLSVGEVTALAAAGVFSFGDGLRLVKTHAEAMQEASSLRPQAVLSVVGLDEAKVARCCEEARADAAPDECCQISGRLFHKGLLVAGTRAAVERCKALCEKSKALQARFVASACAAHSPLMAPARARLEAALRELGPRLAPPRCKVFMNVDGCPVDWDTEPRAIADKLAAGLTVAALWKDCVESMVADGAKDFFELGPGKTLKATLKRIDTGAWSRTANIEV